ncbi:hypothetical protein EMIT043CA1_140016 [Pseudomonas brassicacearum]
MGACLLLLGFNRRCTPRFVSHFAAMARILRSNAYTNHAGSRAQYGEQVEAGARRYSKGAPQCPSNCPTATAPASITRTWARCRRNGIGTTSSPSG